MYNSSSLQPLSLSLSKLPVSDSSPLLPVKQLLPSSIPSWNMCFPTSSKNCCGRDACVCGGGGGGGAGISHFTYGIWCNRCLLFIRFHKPIWKLFPIEPQRHKFTVHISGPPWTTMINFCKPVVHAMVALVTMKVSWL